MPFPPLRYWQRRHQHALAARGAEFAEKRTALHKHPPVFAMGQPLHLIESKGKILALILYEQKCGMVLK